MLNFLVYYAISYIYLISIVTKAYSSIQNTRFFYEKVVFGPVLKLS